MYLAVAEGVAFMEFACLQCLGNHPEACSIPVNLEALASCETGSPQRFSHTFQEHKKRVGSGVSIRLASIIAGPNHKKLLLYFQID